MTRVSPGEVDLRACALHVGTIVQYLVSIGAIRGTSELMPADVSLVLAVAARLRRHQWSKPTGL